MELRRQEGRWTVNGFAADSAVVAGFWNAVEEAEVRDLVGSNPANHPRLGVAADSAWTLVLELGEEDRALLVGKAGTTYGTVYVRLPAEDAVHLLEGNLRPEVTRDLEQWRNKRMARVDTAQVGRVEVTMEEDAYALERADTLWTLDGRADTNAATVRSLLGELANLQATGFYAPGDSLPALGASVTVLSQAGDTLVYLEVGGGEGDRWARVRGDSIVYRLPSWRISRLLPERAELRSE
jgi:hypothetical protein